MTYLGCVLDKKMSEEQMVSKAINKINGKLKFFYRKNRFLSPELRRMLCNALIQSQITQNTNYPKKRKYKLYKINA